MITKTKNQVNENFLTQTEHKCFIIGANDEYYNIILARSINDAICKLLNYHGQLTEAYKKAIFNIEPDNYYDLIQLYNAFVGYDEDYISFISECNSLHIALDCYFIK